MTLTPLGRTLRTACALPALVLLMAGCGTSGGGGDDAPPRAPKSAEPPPTARTYDREHTRVEAAVGERFALEVADRTSAGYAWIVEAPRPDGAVLRAEGERTEHDEERVGSFGTRYFDFRALSPGSTKVVLRGCYRCGTSHERVDENHPETRLTFEVTVRK